MLEKTPVYNWNAMLDKCGLICKCTFNHLLLIIIRTINISLVLGTVPPDKDDVNAAKQLVEHQLILTKHMKIPQY